MSSFPCSIASPLDAGADADQTGLELDKDPATRTHGADSDTREISSNQNEVSRFMHVRPT